MNDRCPSCGGVIGSLLTCIECGLCIICNPGPCECEWEDLWEADEEEEEEE